MLRKYYFFIMLLLIASLMGCTTSFDSDSVLNEDESTSSESVNEGMHLGDCPFGRTECEYPGNCGGYVDEDNDGNCDHTLGLLLN